MVKYSFNVISSIIQNIFYVLLKGFVFVHSVLNLSFAKLGFFSINVTTFFAYLVIINLLCLLVVKLQISAIFNIGFLILICLPLTILVVICIPIIYGTFWAYTHSDLEKLLVSPSSLFTAEIVGLLAGVDIKDALSSDFFHQNKSTPIYEIHMNLKHKKTILTKEDLLAMSRGISFHLAGSIVYTITPMNLEKIIQEYSFPCSHVIALKSKINPERAIKIRNKPSYYWF